MRIKSLQRVLSPKYRGKKSKRRRSGSGSGGGNISSCHSNTSTDADISKTMGSTSRERTARGVLDTVVMTIPHGAQVQEAAASTVVSSPIPTLDESDMESMCSFSPSCPSLRKNERSDKIGDLKRRLRYAEERADACLTENAARNRSLCAENDELRRRLANARPTKNMPTTKKKHRSNQQCFRLFGFLCIAISCLGLVPFGTFLRSNPKRPYLNSAAQICRMTAASRALAHKDPNNFYSEPLAELLAGEEMMNFVSDASDPSTKSVTAVGKKNEVSEGVARAMVVDKTLEVYTNGIHTPKQVVIIGAGMDTRAHRLHLPGVTYYEIDQSDVIDLKEDLLDLAGIQEEGVPVKRVRLDLSGADLDVMYEKLAEVGFESSSPVIYVMEGLLYYLTVHEAKRLLTALKGTPKSRIISSVVDAKRRINAPYSMLEKVSKSDLQELRRAGTFKLDKWEMARAQSITRRLKGLNVGVSYIQSSKGHEMIVEFESK